MAETARRFFSDPDEKAAQAVPQNHPRTMTAAAEVLNFRKKNDQFQKRTGQAWQKAAWGYYDQVGELKFAFNLISQIVSRAFLYAAISEDTADIPVDVDDFLKKMPADSPPENVGQICKAADEAMRNLIMTSDQSEFLRSSALNMAIAGEFYLYFDEEKNKWCVASIDEFRPGNPPTLHSSRGNASVGSATASGNSRTLPQSTYAARIWRKHPRWSEEADSSMLGVLDQVEKVVLFDQVMRAISRSRLNAGIVYIPNGLETSSGVEVDKAISDFVKNPIESEESAEQVTPLVLTGPPESGKLLSRIDLAREIDENLLKAAEMAMDRTLAGLDIPKDVVSGLSDVKYANSVVIDDSLYKAHIEPLILLICDALTTAYLHPMLRKLGFDAHLIERMTIWYNPSQIVTRPDRSQSANEGFDRMLISGDAWRRARGYSELDAPTKDELIYRLALEKVQIPPELAATLIEHIHPQFFNKQKEQNAAASGITPDIGQMLNGGQPDPAKPPPGQPDESITTTMNESGGGVNPNGAQPPPTPGPGPGRPDV